MHMGSIVVPLPEYKTKGAAGLDLQAAISSSVTILPGGRATISTGLAFAIPEGFEGQIRARSGTARSHGITVTNGVGTIDSDYRGLVEILLTNLGHLPFPVLPLQRIAQLVICPIVQAELELVVTLDETERGERGFGSTKS